MSIGVGILAGHGFTIECKRCLQSVLSHADVSHITMLFPIEQKEAVIIKKYDVEIILERETIGQIGVGREALRKNLANRFDVMVLIDDDVILSKNYFKEISENNEFINSDPTVGCGRLINSDGSRSWDICYFREDGHSALAPYDLINKKPYCNTLYASGAQSIHNKSAQKMMIPYKNQKEDSGFGIDFLKAGGNFVIFKNIHARLLHFHNCPNPPESLFKTP